MGRFRTTTAIGIVVITATALATAQPVAADAVLAAHANTTAEASSETCSYDLTSGTVTCYEDFAEFVTTVTHGRITDISEPTALSDADVRRIASASALGPDNDKSLATTNEFVSAASTYILVQLFENSNYTGDTFQFTGSSPCDTSSDLDRQANIPLSFNDRTSSFRSYSECQTRIYENTNYGGASYGAYTNSSYVGDAMNDRASSVRFY